MMHFLLVALGMSVTFNLALFLVAYRFKTDRLTDASYALTFIALAWFAFRTGGPGTGVAGQQELLALVTIWALRLGGFLLFRVWKTKRDKRFDGIRENFWKFGRFWLAQGVSVWVILLPALLYFQSTFGVNTTKTYVCGVLVWLAGFVLETVADLQKYRFSRNAANKDKWIQEGVWRWSRHPNYFGEMLVWAGIWVAVAGSLSWPQKLVSLAGPLFIISLLRFVSGVPPLEKSADARWGHLPTYQAYKKRTSLLIPLPPKK
ncbi:MAG TPA: DUF1295 domain-containing protein [Candidatus Saccharimonadales bacterium]|nr:DUF1295 domain-containing protein [Candidatus Saccharimonadales bacterium]